jgi:hypothetical protein
MKFSKPLELDCCSLSVGVLSRAGIVEVPGRLGALLDLELTSVTESNTKTELAKIMPELKVYKLENTFYY